LFIIPTRIQIFARIKKNKFYSQNLACKINETAFPQFPTPVIASGAATR
jgi:hypothetical protein